MKIIEELKLKKTIEYINRFEAKQVTLEKIYQNIGDLNLFSIQGMSYQFDKEFFDEVSFVLSVIITIIKHPHIASYDIDEIIRADLAGHIENDSFQMVFKDPKLWRDKNDEMIPEEVYYHEHIDEIKIYENIFIGMLINLIEQDLKKSQEFYVSLLPTLKSKKVLQTNAEVKYALGKIEKELKKIRYIKETFFYKQIKKCNLNLRKIIPTNILLKDRLYNYCFKFYKKFIRYEDASVLDQDYTKYYFYLLLQQFKKRKATLVKVEDKDLYLNYGTFEVGLKVDNKLPVIHLELVNQEFKNDVDLLCIVDNGISEPENYTDKESGYIATIWNLFDLSLQQLNDHALTESLLIGEVIEQATKVITVDPDIYSKRCPVCKTHGLNIENNIYSCDECGTKYVFLSDDKIWILRTRGK